MCRATLLEQTDAWSCSAAALDGLPEVLYTLSWPLCAIHGALRISCFSTLFIVGLDSVNPVKAGRELELQRIMVQNIAPPLLLELLLLDPCGVFIILIIITRA